MLLEYFKQYIKVSRGITDKSVGHYITGINTINTILSKNNYPISNVFNVKCIEDLDAIFGFLASNEEFRQKDDIGHNMYSVAFKHFYNFAREDSMFFADNIEKMDIAVAKPNRVITSTEGWERNRILISQAIDGAHHKCEQDNSHVTFVSKSTGKDYMEGHHLIPLKYQDQFDVGIDIYANIVCLCPICHRLIHFGNDCDKTYVADKLFDERKDRLINSGIDISRNDFIKLVI